MYMGKPINNGGLPGYPPVCDIQARHLLEQDFMLESLGIAQSGSAGDLQALTAAVAVAAAGAAGGDR